MMTIAPPLRDPLMSASPLAITADIGTVVAGVPQDSSGSHYIDLDAAVGDPFLDIGALILRKNGKVQVASGTDLEFGGVVSSVGVLDKGVIGPTQNTAGGGKRGIAILYGAAGATLVDMNEDQAEFNFSAFRGAAGTADLHLVDAGTASATEAGWVEVTIGGSTMYLRAFSAK